MYVPLHVHSNYSFLEGASFPEELVMQAAAYDLPAVAITDRDGLYGVVRAHVAAREAGMKLLVGATITRSDAPPLVLLATRKSGYGAICRLISLGRGQSEKGESSVTTDQVAHCVNRHVLAIHPALFQEPRISRLQSLFAGRLYAGLARYMLPGDSALNQAVADAALRHSIPLVVAPVVMFHTPQRKGLSDILTAIRHTCTVDQLGTATLPNANFTLHPPAVMRRIWHDETAALHRTLDIADQCSFSLDELAYHYPSEVVPPGETPISYLTRLTGQKARERYSGLVPPDVDRQLRHELALIEELDFPNYFLTMYDIVRFAREQDILCQGRGSAANSAVCYVLGITAVDPVAGRLLFERFISKERNEPPDIDVDFEHERREEVIQYIYNRFGRQRAAMVANFIRYRTRSAIRDVGKALGLSVPQVERLSNLSSSLKRDYEDWWERATTQAGFDPAHPKIVACRRYVREIRAFPRHLGIHVGGFVISDIPVHRLVPIEPARMEGRTVIQWDKEDVEDAGLLKIDVLGLGMLTCLKKSFEMLKEPLGIDLNLYSIPQEDEKTYEMIRGADTVGVFQIESRAQMSMLPRLKPRTFYDLVVEVAIVRPGPIQGNMVHPYLRRRRGEEPVSFPLPQLKPVLERTYGVPLFQEQVMKLAMVAGGFTAGEADALRRAMGTWRSSGRLEGLLNKLMVAMERNGIDHDYALQIANQIKGFGEYGFPESHAASFALLAYASAYVKCHHPAVFTAALLNSQPMGFYSPATLVEDARRHNVTILPMDVNHSQWMTSITPGTAGILPASPPSLRLGLSLIRGLREDDARQLLSARQKRGLFRSLEDLFQRTRLSVAALLKLALAGAFCSLNLKRREALWAVLQICRDRDTLFHAAPLSPALEQSQPMTPFQVVMADLDATRIFQSLHPFELVYPALKKQPEFKTAAQLANARHQSRVVVGGLAVVKQRPPTAGGVLFLTLEDHTGLMNLVVHSRVRKRFLRVALEEPLLLAHGTLEKVDGVTNIMVTTLKGIHLVERKNSFQVRQFR